MNLSPEKVIYVTVDYTQPLNGTFMASLKYKAQKMNAVIKDQTGKVLFQPVQEKPLA
jgi:hypothetical protein